MSSEIYDGRYSREAPWYAARIYSSNISGR